MLNGLDLFSGIGGISLALQPWVRTVCYVENEPYCQQVLRERIGDGRLDDAPIWDDVRTFDPRPWAGAVDIVSGGFPCQDISTASHGRGGGLYGVRSGLWIEMLRIIDGCRPAFVFVENIARWRSWLPDVRRALWRRGYASMPIRMRADTLGAPHPGERIYVVAATDSDGKPALPIHAQMAELQASARLGWSDWGEPPPCALGVADGVPARVDRLRGLGNAVVPACAREAFARLMGSNTVQRKEA